VAPQAL